MTRQDWVSTIGRLFCGIVFVQHGADKVFNLDGTIAFFDSLGLPVWTAVPVAYFEMFGGLLLVAGLLTRVLSLLFILEMTVAAFKVQQPFALETALIVLLAGILLLGPGPLSVDALLSRRKTRAAAAAASARAASAQSDAAESADDRLTGEDAPDASPRE
ncbi:MAG: DoxX family protein [Gemmatimonadota bacterium]